MQSEKKLIMETLLWDLILKANRVREAVDKAIWLRVNCGEMERQVSQLQQILDTLQLCLAFGPIHHVMTLRLMLNSDDVGIVEGLMLCLAKLVGAEHGELQCNYLTSIMEITAAAESNLDLRCKAFKTNSSGAKAIVERLLRVINQSEDPKLQVLAIRSIGYLARIFSERTNHHVIDALVLQLGNGHQEVATEAVVALIKFACEENYLCKAHSKRMIELNAVQPLVKLLTDGEWTQLQLHGLELMCYLALNADYSKAMEEARVRTTIQRLVTGKKGRRTVVSQHPELKELVAKALRDLTLYYKY